jgi:hypothetical protein
MKVNTQAIHPAIVEGVGGRKGGGWWVDTTADRAVAAVAVVAAVGTVAAAASERPEEAETAARAEFRPVEDDDEAADVRLRARDGLAMVGDSETR